MMRKLLMVDDEPITIHLLRLYFRTKGFEVITAFDGEDALTRASTEAPNAIILDLMLPGITGYEVCRMLRTLPATAHVPILVYSAAACSPQTVTAAGADAYLRKPTALLDVAKTLTKLLEPLAPSA